jgi:hypothetical protein
MIPNLIHRKSSNEADTDVKVVPYVIPAVVRGVSPGSTNVPSVTPLRSVHFTPSFDT